MFCWRYWKRSSFLLCVWNFVDFITLSVFHENWSIFWVSKTDVMFFSCWPNLYTFSFLFFFQLLTNVLFIHITTFLDNMRCFSLFHPTPWKDNSSYFLCGTFGFLFAWFAVFRLWYMDTFFFFPLSPMCTFFQPLFSVPLGFTGNVTLQYWSRAWMDFIFCL